METNPISVCGTDCSTCYCFEKMCKGCNAQEGKVFYVPQSKACPIYECVRNKKGLPHCGKCGTAPCEIWQNTRDPKYSDEEFAENISMRVQKLSTLEP